MAFQCNRCGETHDELPDIGSDRPDQYWDVDEPEREKRIELTEDTCIIGNEYFFIRGVLEIPIINQEDRFGFGVWVSQKKENFEAYLLNYDSNEIGPFFGWLCTEIAYYEQSTLFLKTMAHFRGHGLRPVIIVSPSEHPLPIDQSQGISLEEAWEIVHFYTPPRDK